MGRELGAGDYLAKPFSPRELVARIKVGLRRAVSAPNQSMAGALRFDGCTINPESRVVSTNGGNAQLTSKEFDLLFFLAIQPRPRLYQGAANGPGLGLYLRRGH